MVLLINQNFSIWKKIQIFKNVTAKKWFLDGSANVNNNGLRFSLFFFLCKGKEANAGFEPTILW